MGSKREILFRRLERFSPPRGQELTPLVWVHFSDSPPFSDNRVFDRGNGPYELTVLKKPINDETGVRPFYEVNLDTATRTEEFSLAGGITEYSYRPQVTSSAPQL